MLRSCLKVFKISFYILIYSIKTLKKRFFRALDVEVFNIGNEYYLIAANSGDGNSYVTSNLYRF